MTTLQTNLFGDTPTLIPLREQRVSPPRPAPVKNPAAARAAKTAGMEQVEETTSEEWKLDAFCAVQNLACRKPFLTTDDVWEMLMAGEGANPSAIGPIMQRAKREGLIAPTDTYKTSERETRHCNRLRVWKSLLFAEGEAH